MPTISELPAETLGAGDLIPAVVDGVTSAVSATAIGADMFNAADAAAGRSAIGAGTSSLVVGSTAGAALAVAGAAGSATTAARSDHVHPRQLASVTLMTGYTIGTDAPVAAGDSVMAAIAKLEARIVALENPA